MDLNVNVLQVHMKDQGLETQYALLTYGNMPVQPRF